MSIDNTTTENMNDEYRASDGVDYTDGVEVVDADSIEDPTNYDAPEPTDITIIQQPKPEPESADENAVVKFADEALPVNTFDESRTRFTREEAIELTDEIKRDFLNVAEAQYQLSTNIAKAYEGRVWIALEYPKGREGWVAYCKDNFTAEAVKLSAKQRTDLILNFDPNAQISNKALAAALGVSDMTVSRARNKIAGPEGKPKTVKGTDGRMYAPSELKGEDRRRFNAKILEMAESGMKEKDIAAATGLSQSRVNEVKQEERERRASAGNSATTIHPVDIEGEVLDSDQPLWSAEDGVDQTREMWINARIDAFRDASEAVDTLKDDLEDDDWKLGSPSVSEVIDKVNGDLLVMFDGIGMILAQLTAAPEGQPDDEENDAGTRLEELLGGGERARSMFGSLTELQRILERILG
ncbi:hypothetical protein CSQ85_11710 [Bifidobacterium rousetti]|uniref:hypothetical protein n=1 Tax=Bifidobacterium rousetti TaxID=2045439 RepID=UPI001238413A|nr:hypothetical protein [Bifidobacterium rousetti]KAA8816766.1 hypothetical protein CSQ85_11710 [Bifidobacterium rousetti]